MFRAILALLVFVSHVSRFNVGKLAVLMFFLLSGYWVTSIWRRQFSQHNPLWFYASRYFRLIPVYLLVVVIVALAFDRPLLPNLMLLGIASTPDYDVISVSWSLDIELQFYLTLPLFLAFIPRVGRIEILGSLVLGAIGWLTFEQSGISTALQYLPAFALGAYLHDNQIRPSARTASLSLAAFVVVTLVLALLPVTQNMMLKTRELPAGSDLFSMVWMLPLVPYIACSLHKRSSATDRHLGNLSYPFYLVHTAVIAGLRFGFQGMLLKIVALAVTSLLSLLIYWLFDRPVDKLRHRIFTPSAKMAATLPT